MGFRSVKDHRLLNRRIYLKVYLYSIFSLSLLLLFFFQPFCFFVLGYFSGACNVGKDKSDSKQKILEILSGYFYYLGYFRIDLPFVVLEKII